MGTNKHNMKLQKQSSRKRDDPNYEKYVKWVLVISSDRINQLGWKEGVELKDEIKGNTLCINQTNNSNEKNKEEMLYDEFKMAIKNILERHPSGLTWTQIRDKLNLPQKFPNNKWVNMLRRDIGLRKIKIGKDAYWNFEYDAIYTIGYEGYEIEKFVKKLRDSNIQQLIDVRELPLSRKNGFSKEILKSKLKEVGIRYTHLKELGSPRNIRYQLYKDMDYEKFFIEYQKHINDEDVMQNISVIEGLAKRRKSVIMCFEKSYEKCHRKIIADELKRRGWKISYL